MCVKVLSEVLGDEVCTGSPGLFDWLAWNVWLGRELPSVGLKGSKLLDMIGSTRKFKATEW